MRDNSKLLAVVGGAVVVAVIAFLAFGVFGVQTLFTDQEVAEANPFETTEAGAADTPADSSGEDTSPSVSSTTAAQPAAETDTSETAEADGDDTESSEADASAGSPRTVSTGPFVDGDHPTSGTALTLTDGTRSFLRFEDFATDNGPDLNVYLRSSQDPDDFIDLGDLKGNIGEQNYELPADIDLTRYDLVDIWCVRFGVSFGSAALSAQGA